MIYLVIFIVICVLLGVWLTKWIDDDIDFRMGVDTKAEWAKRYKIKEGK